MKQFGFKAPGGDGNVLIVGLLGTQVLLKLSVNRARVIDGHFRLDSGYRDGSSGGDRTVGRVQFTI